MSTGLQMLSASEPIPVGQWRLGIFVMSQEVMAGYSDEYIKSYIGGMCSKAGVAVALSTLRPLAIDLRLQGKPALVWGGWVENQNHGLTTTEFIGRTKLPAQFAVETAPDIVEHYLSVFQGHAFGEVIDPRPIKWSTPQSPLQVGVWYPAYARWISPPPTAVALEQKLKAAGFDLFRTRGFDPVLELGNNTLGFWLYSGDSPVTVEQVRQAIGAASVVVNLEGALDDPDVTWINDLAEQGEEVLSNISATITSVSNGLQKATGAATTAFDFIGWLIEWGPILAAGGAAVYLGSRAYRSMKKPKRVTA